MNKDLESDDFDILAQRLTLWAEKQNLLEKALQGLAKCFENEGGIIDGWTIAEMRPQFRDHALCFSSALYSYPFVKTTFHLFSPDDIHSGEYRLLTTLDGEIDDDFLLLDVTKSEYEQKHF